MPSAANIVLLALALFVITDALPVWTSTSILVKSSDVFPSSLSQSSNATSVVDGSSAFWVDSLVASIATYVLAIYCIVSCCLFLGLYINRLGAEDLVFQCFDCFSDCLAWPLDPTNRSVSFPMFSDSFFTLTDWARVARPVAVDGSGTLYFEICSWLRRRIGIVLSFIIWTKRAYSRSGSLPLVMAWLSHSCSVTAPHN